MASKKPVKLFGFQVSPSEIIEIVSGEGPGEGTVEVYTGARTEAALKHKLKEESSQGDRWAQARVKGRNVRLLETEQSIAALRRTRLKQSRKLAVRYVQAEGVERGRSVVVGSVRIHRFNDSFKVWDLTNAGKRGKKVRVMSLSPSNSYPEDRGGWMESMGKALPHYTSYDRIKSLILDILSDHPNEIDIHESMERGIDVNPGDTTSISIKTPEGLEIKADPYDWSVKSRQEMQAPEGGLKFFQDTLYYPAKKKVDTAPFFNWLKANLSLANKMTIVEMKDLWRSLGIGYDSH